jgi:excisionase family DNA binding protein
LNSEELISLAEAAAISGLSPTHLNHLARRGFLRAWKIGRNWVTTREAVAEYLGDVEKRRNDPHKRNR